jgi:hypothetical protein
LLQIDKILPSEFGERRCAGEKKMSRMARLIPPVTGNRTVGYSPSMPIA